jgi:hypothetical protein
MMYSQPTGPRSIGGVLDDGVRLYRDSFRSILPLLIVSSLLSLVPGLFLGVNSAVGATQAERMSALVQTMASPKYWVTVIVLAIINLGIYGALFAAIDRVAKGGRMGVGEALQFGLSHLGRMIGVSFLWALTLFVGFMLFLIPGIYLMGALQLVFVAVILEDAGVFQSFSTSFRLIKGYWWRSTIIVTVAIIILVVLAVLVSTVAGFLAVLGTSPGTLLIVNQIVGALLNVIIVGWLPCVLLAMYYDLKLRHEGQDLATRVDALAAR